MTLFLVVFIKSLFQREKKLVIFLWAIYMYIDHFLKMAYWLFLFEEWILFFCFYCCQISMSLRFSVLPPTSDSLFQNNSLSSTSWWYYFLHMVAVAVSIPSLLSLHIIFPSLDETISNIDFFISLWKETGLVCMYTWTFCFSTIFSFFFFF